MNFRGLTFAAFFIAAALSTTTAVASSISNSGDMLFSNPNLNRNLEPAQYSFSNQHYRYGIKFKDSWKFTVADNTSVSLNLQDLNSNTGLSTALRPTNARQLQIPRFSNRFSSVFDTRDLTLSIYDKRGRLLGQTGEDGALNNLSLIAGGWYTIAVTGRVNSAAGSLYHGVLSFDSVITPSVTPAPVPLGDTAPMLGSALAVLALRLRKRVG